MRLKKEYKELLDFAQAHAGSEVQQLRLKYGRQNLPFDLDLAIAQISGRRHMKKFPFLADHPGFLFPHELSAEQATDSRVAEWHASLIRPGEKVLDMTAGLGVDAFAMARRAASITAMEKNRRAAEMLIHNREVLGIENMTVVEGDSAEFIRTSPERFSTIFIDPARRDREGGRTYGFADCEPDLTKIWDAMLEKGGRILVKGSPMLDLQATAAELPGISAITCVSLNGEMKEVLIEASRDQSPEGLRCRCIDLGWHQDFEVSGSLSSLGGMAGVETASQAPAGCFIYEPMAGIMKIGCWRTLQEKWKGLKKCGPNCHLFVADELFEDFPGKVFRCLGPLKKGEAFGGNVVSRNHPLGAEALKKKFRIGKGGDDDFAMGLRIGEKPTVLIAKLIKR